MVFGLVRRLGSRGKTPWTPPATASVKVRRSKTRAGERNVPLSPKAREALAEWLAQTPHSKPSDPIIACARGAEGEAIAATPNSIAQLVRAAYRLAGIFGASSHSRRRAKPPISRLGLTRNNLLSLHT